MAIKLTKEQEILLELFRNPFSQESIRGMAKKINFSPAGALKVFRKLQKRDLVISQKIGSSLIYSLNKDNILVNKEVEMILTIESQNYLRWIEEFRKLEEESIFVIIFGSIIKNEKEAKDIDLLVCAEAKNFDNIKKIIKEKDNILSKKVHLIFQTKEDFKKDFIQKNKVTIEIIKTGVILFGQENFRGIVL